MSLISCCISLHKPQTGIEAQQDLAFVFILHLQIILHFIHTLHTMHIFCIEHLHIHTVMA